MNWFTEILAWLDNLLIDLFPRSNHTEPIKDLPMNQPALPSLPKYLWDTRPNCVHSARLIMDEYDLDWAVKADLCAIIHQESNFNPRAVGKQNANGTTDYGLLQFNNGKNAKGVAYWIGPGAAFADIADVLDHPTKNVHVLIEQYKAGNLKLWSSYSSGAYKQWRGLYL